MFGRKNIDAKKMKQKIDTWIHNEHTDTCVDDKLNIMCKRIYLKNNIK